MMHQHYVLARSHSMFERNHAGVAVEWKPYKVALILDNIETNSGVRVEDFRTTPRGFASLKFD